MLGDWVCSLRDKLVGMLMALQLRERCSFKLLPVGTFTLHLSIGIKVIYMQFIDSNEASNYSELQIVMEKSLSKVAFIHLGEIGYLPLSGILN